MSTVIRTANTKTTRSVRQESDQRSLSDGSREPLIRVALNVDQLVQILRYGHIREQNGGNLQRPIKNDKKRAAPDVARPTKRAKTGLISSSPILYHTSPEADAVKETVQVYSHLFELRYTRRCDDEVSYIGHFADDGRASQIGWLREEAELIDVLSAKSDENGSPIFELGEVTMGDHGGEMQLFHDSRPNPDDDELYFIHRLLTLPTVPFPDHYGESGSVLHTCWVLQHSGHVSISSSASLVYIPSIPAPDLPIQINVTISVSLVLPNIFIPQAFHVPLSASPEDKRRRFLSYLIYPHPNSTDLPKHESQEEASIRHFYSILKPASPVPSLVVNDALQPEGLRAILLPFQRRSVKWLLERESKSIDATGRITSKVEDPEALPLFWQRVKMPLTSVKGKQKESHSGASQWWYYNRLTGSLTAKIPAATDVLGAMLCEEMGLGKTLECLALILLNPTTERDPSTTHWDAKTELEVSAIKTNLIVTPATLSQQWLDEIARHAPSLNVLFYTGYSKVKLPKAREVKEGTSSSSTSHSIWSSYFHGFDVVVTTYKTLQDELGVAKAPIVRPKRQVASYSHVEKVRSPLVRVEWARVFMDEVQLVGGGKTAEMVSLIPRKVSIAVSGTPARSKVSDLSHVLKFLRVNEAIGTSRTWDHLLKPEFQDLFADLFRKYAIRTLKTSVKDELTIPPQRRFAIGIELGKVEKHIYDQTLQEALDELGVDARGVAASEGWEIDIGLLRNWLRRLRQICTHPQVGHLQNNKALTKVSGTTIKTMHEVLQDLQTKNWQTLTLDRRSKIQLILRRAQLTQQVDDDSTRYEKSRALLLNAQTETTQLVEDIQVTIAAHEDQGRRLKEETAARRRERKQTAEDVSLSKGKGKARDISVELSSDEDSEDSGLPHTRVGEEYRARQRNLQARLRETYILQHKVAFLLGDVYHALGPEHSQAEDASYAVAEDIRKLILKTTDEAATSSMLYLSQTFCKPEPMGKKDLKVGPCQKGGIRSTQIMEDANDILDLVNEQADLLWEWRSRIFTLLTQNLSTLEGEQADGEEYGRALDAQGEVEEYLQAYATVIADRKEAFIAERTALAIHDAREIKLRDTQVSRRAAGVASPIQDDNLALHQQLEKARDNLRVAHESRALKTMMILLSDISNRAGDRSEEGQIARDEAKRLRNIITDQGKLMEKLELELALFRKVFNDRIQYFKQLQELSDTVVEVEWEGDVRDAIESSGVEVYNLTTVINRKRAQARHLQSLAKDEEEGGLDEARDCVLCRCAFQVGLITPCAHVFCERCLMEWLKARHADCPVCRSKVKISTLQRISLNQDDTGITNRAAKDGRQEAVAPDRSVQFNSLPRETLDEIQTFEAHGSYGSKITHLIRHLLYLQKQEPGTKSVVFSAWSDSLTIIEQALNFNGITCIRVDQKGKQNAAQRFKADPGILVFLLHGERENAGLNLTCAKRVWLIEPTVNHSFEVQAISRVDRMGQTAATEVFCYYIEDTVEENILRLGARQGFSLYVRDRSGDAIDISEFAMGTQKTHVDSPSKRVKQKGDFVEKAEDLIHVLFPHIDYQDTDLAGLTDDPLGIEAMDVGSDFGVLDASSSNAVAGPSRLR